MPNNSADKLKQTGEVGNKITSAALDWLLSLPFMRTFARGTQPSSVVHEEMIQPDPENVEPSPAPDVENKMIARWRNPISHEDFLAACALKENWKEASLSELILNRLLTTLIPRISESIRTIDLLKLIEAGEVKLELTTDQVLRLPDSIKVKQIAINHGCLNISALVANKELSLSADVTGETANYFEARLIKLLQPLIGSSDLLGQALDLSSFEYDLFVTESRDVATLTVSFSVNARLNSISGHSLTRLSNCEQNTFPSGADFMPIRHSFVATKNTQLLATYTQPSVVNGQVVWPDQPYFAEFINGETARKGCGKTHHVLSRIDSDSQVIEDEVGYVLTEIVVTESGIAVTLSPQCEPLEPAACLQQAIQSHYLDQKVYGSNVVAIRLQQTPEITEALDAIRVEKDHYLARIFGFEQSVVSVSTPTVRDHVEEDRRLPGSIHG